MTSHTTYRNGIYTVRTTRGGANEGGQVEYAATASSRDKKEAYAASVDRLNKKTRGIYAPIELHIGFVQ